MTSRSVGAIGIALLAMVVCSPAQAFPDDSDNAGSPPAWQQDRPPEQPPADYRYSGNGFNFSMSRSLTQPDGAPAAQGSDADQPPPSRSKPGFFRRTLHSIFGD